MAPSICREHITGDLHVDGQTGLYPCSWYDLVDCSCISPFALLLVEIQLKWCGCRSQMPVNAILDEIQQLATGTHWKYHGHKWKLNMEIYEIKIHTLSTNNCLTSWSKPFGNLIEAIKISGNEKTWQWHRSLIIMFAWNLQQHEKWIHAVKFSLRRCMCFNVNIVYSAREYHPDTYRRMLNCNFIL